MIVPCMGVMGAAVCTSDQPDSRPVQHWHAPTCCCLLPVLQVFILQGAGMQAAAYIHPNQDDFSTYQNVPQSLLLRFAIAAVWFLLLGLAQVCGRWSVGCHPAGPGPSYLGLVVPASVRPTPGGKVSWLWLNCAPDRLAAMTPAQIQTGHHGRLLRSLLLLPALSTGAVEGAAGAQVCWAPPQQLHRPAVPGQHVGSGDGRAAQRLLPARAQPDAPFRWVKMLLPACCESGCRVC